MVAKKQEITNMNAAANNPPIYKNKGRHAKKNKKNLTKVLNPA